MQIRNLIFDLGAVLFAIEPRRSTMRFLSMMPGGRPGPNFPAGIKDAADMPVFRQLELGLLAPEDFPEALRAATGIKGSDAELVAAWNSLLEGVYPGREAALQKLRKRFRLALLSNTNRVHFAHLHAECAELFACFDHLFYSFDLGLRKPDPEIYRVVLAQTGYEAAQTLFVDDSITNVQAAQALGIQTFWFEEGAEGKSWDDLAKLLES